MLFTKSFAGGELGCAGELAEYLEFSMGKDDSRDGASWEIHKVDVLPVLSKGEKR